jgi:hypothetical protein
VAGDTESTVLADRYGVAEPDTDGLSVWPGETVTEALSVPVEEGLAKPLAVVISELLPLPLPLKVHGVCEPTAELVLDTNGDLVAAEAVKLVVAEAIPDEVCVLTTVLVIDADAVTDFDQTADADWLIDPELLLE